MKRFVVIFSVVVCILRGHAAWYWPFGSADDDQGKPRLSELMEPATRYIDAASDYADEGKVDEAVAEYVKALEELARVQLENPERAETAEFATVRNKRAYIESAIDSLLLKQAQRNAKAVAVTDTTSLERRFAEERAARAAARANRGKTASDRGRAPTTGAAPSADSSPALAAEKVSPLVVETVPEKPTAVEPPPPDRRTRMLQARDALAAARLGEARTILGELLDEKPGDPAALNLLALVEKAAGDPAAAELTLKELIQTNPTVYYGYYNLAKLVLERRGAAGVQAARRYYRSGRELCGGPVDTFLEEHLK